MPDHDLRMRLLLLVFAGILGGIAGSFLNAFIHRWPLRISMWKKARSFCPRCKHSLAWYDNVPVISYVLLLGRCRYCSGRIHPRYLVVEMLTVALFLAVFYQEAVLNRSAVTGWGAPYFPWPKIAVHLVLVAALVGVSFIDCLVTRIPDEVTLPGIAAAPVLSALVPALQAGMRFGDGVFSVTGVLRLDAFLACIAGIFICGGALWALGVVGEAIMKKPAMGFGDVKLMAMVGGLLGAPTALLGIAFAAFIGSLVGGINLALTGRHRIPFGPFLAIGTFIAMMWGAEIVYLYLRFAAGDAAPPAIQALFFPPPY
ncbi:MAG TPA: prepilin peptidase [Planctomycetes bacterium]|nr:prepilin peptidase [Planctomycetota bacterium]